MLTIQKEGLPTIKLWDAINNGDIATVFFNEEYKFMNVKDRIVIDIGANIGDSAIYFALKDAKEIIALEPFTNNFESAKRNIVENKLDQKIKVLQAGCSGKTGHMTIDEK